MRWAGLLAALLLAGAWGMLAPDAARAGPRGCDPDTSCPEASGQPVPDSPNGANCDEDTGAEGPFGSGGASGAGGAGGGSGGGAGGGAGAGSDDCDNACSGGGCAADPAKCGCSAGDPVDLFTGRLNYARTDLVVKGVYPIRITRVYNSQSRYDSPLGYGWALSFDLRIFEYPDGALLVRRPNGRRDRYLPDGAGGFVYAGALTVRDTVAPDGAGGHILTRPRGTRAFFDTRGFLTAVEDPQGNRLELTYDPAGKLPLWGTTPFALDPSVPIVVAQTPHLTEIREVLADGTVTGRAVTLSYDLATGRLTGVQSADGRTVSYQHEPAADPDGITRTTGNLTGVTGLEGIQAAYGYTDPAGPHNLTSIQESAGTTPVVNTYTADDRVAQQTFGTNTLDFTYATGSTTLTRTVSDTQGQVLYSADTVHTWDPEGYPLTVTDPLGHQLEYVRYSGSPDGDPDKYPATTRLWRNTGTPASPSLVLQKEIAHRYDPEGNQTIRDTKVFNPDGTVAETITETWTYDHSWVASYEVVSDADLTEVFRTEFTFERRDLNGDGIDPGDPVANIASIRRQRADGSFETTTLDYNANGRFRAITLPDSHRVVRIFTGAADPQPGLVKEVFHDDGTGGADPHLRTSYAYDAEGNVSQVTDARGHATDLVWDALGRVVSVTNALGEETVYTYAGPRENAADPTDLDPGSLLRQVEVGRTVADGEGQVTRLLYTAEGFQREIQRKDDAGVLQPFATFTHDSEGRRLTATDAEGRTLAYTYDLLGRLETVTDAVGNTTTFAYDTAGNRTSVTDAKAHETRFVYDARDRLTEVHAVAPNEKTVFAYDAAGNVTGVTDPKSQTTTYGYDALSRLRSVTQPLGQQVRYTYDLRGRLARVVNARGHALDHVYEPWGPLAAVHHYASEAAADADPTHASPDRTVAYAYDLAGNLTSTSDTDIQPTPLYTADPTTGYDPLNRLAALTVHYLPGGDRTLESAYDRFGNRKELRLTDGAEVLVHDWQYDRLDRLDQATFPGNGGVAHDFTYYANDDLQQILAPSGVTTDYLYKPHGPIDRITVTAGAATALDLAYTYDPVLNVDTLTETVEGTAYLHDYSYDAADRLTDRTQTPTGLGLPAQEAFTYDPAGNREDPADPALYAYDANNRIQASPGSTYTFDADGNLATRSDGTTTETFTFDKTSRLRQYTDGTTSARYLYDPFGRRIQKTVDGTATWYLWDGDQLLAEYDATGTRQTRYAYAAGFAPLQAVLGAPGSEAVYDVHTDHLDTPRVLTDTAPQVVWRASYESFGTAALDRDPDGDAKAITFNVRFPGQYFDAGSGLHYNRFRYYDSATGRYVSADPIGQNGGANIFLYAISNPIGDLDPYGLNNFGGPIFQNSNANSPLYRARAPGPLEIMTNARRAAQGLSGPYSRAQRDAYQHCLASCEFASTYGEAAASVAGALNELQGSARGTQTTGDREMDDANNALGRSLATKGPCANCENQCKRALDRGRLITDRYGAGDPYSLGGRTRSGSSSSRLSISSPVPSEPRR